MKVTINIFDESSAAVAYEGTESEIPFTSLGSAYTLIRMGQDGNTKVFEDRVFTKEEAVGKSQYSCREWDFCTSPADCNDDGLSECYGFCAVAYRFEVVDKCVPPADTYYYVTTPELEAISDFPADEGFGVHSAHIEDTGESCNACSVTAVGRSTSYHILAVVMLGIGFAAARMKRKL
ncbi:MAG: hypothetical protein GY854_16445 [Deltaproteobacteria bacterium]|nr:hypothetical protein [Deltaproteobacteria bacterium]